MFKRLFFDFVFLFSFFLVISPANIYAASTPDLAPTLSLSPDSKQAVFSVQNIGAVPIKLTTSNFQIEYGWQDSSGTILWKSTVKINDADGWLFWESEKTLRKGDSGLNFHKDIPPTIWAAKLYVKVDSQGKISESDEVNNLKTLNLGLVDLKPTLSLSADRKKAEFSVSNLNRIPVKLTPNNFIVEYGWKDQAGSVLLSSKLRISNSEGWWPWESERILPPAVLSFRRDVSPPNSAAQFFVKVDSENNIPESDENNNLATVTFGGLPDLKGSINWNQAETQIIFSVYNANVSSVKLTTSNFLLEYGLQTTTGVILFSSILKVSDADGFSGTEKILQPGDNSLVFHRVATPSSRGSYFVNVDSGRQIAESNEDNNVAILGLAGAITPILQQPVPATPTPSPTSSPTPRPTYILKRSRPTASATPTPSPTPSPTPTAAPKRPDLIVDSLIVTRVNPIATVKNIGKAEVRLSGSQGVLVIPPKASGSWLDGSGVAIGSPVVVSLGGVFGPQSFGINSTMQLTFQTQAPQNAKAFKVLVDSAFQIQEENEGNNEKTQELPPPDLPDLTVESITASRVNPTVTVKNIGIGAVRLAGSGGVLVVPPKASGSWLDANGTTVGSPIAVSLGGGFGPSNLNSGQSMQITFSGGAPQNAKAFKVKVDSDSQITESNENNNEKIQDLLLPDVPDLTVDSLTVTRVNPTALIKNIGKAEVRLAGSQGVLVVPPKASGSWLDETGATIGDQTTVSLGVAFGPQSLTTGNTIQITFPTGAPQNAKAFRVKVDSLSQITESNEGNNEKTENLPVPELADLTVESLDISGNNPTATVKNIGTAEVRLAGSGGVLVVPPKASGSWLDANGTTIGSPTTVSLGGAFGPSRLNAGSSLNMTFQTQAPQNAKAFKVKVDSDSQITESNEDNNELQAPIITKDTKVQDLIKYDEQIVVKEIANEKLSAVNAQPTILPGTIRYGFKDFGRRVQILFAFDPEKKVKLHNKFANEKILEANALVDKGKADKIPDHLKSYEGDVAASIRIIEQLKIEKPAVAEKMAAIALEDQLRHQLLFGKFQKNAPKGKSNELAAIQSKTLEHMQATTKFINGEKKIKQAMSDALDKNGSPFKALRNAGVLKKFEKNAPDDIKKIFSGEEDKQVAYFKNSIRGLPKGQKKLFPGYVEQIGADDEGLKEILRETKIEEQITPQDIGLPQGFVVPQFSTFEEYFEWANKFFESDVYKKFIEQASQNATEQFEGREQDTGEEAPTSPSDSDSTGNPAGAPSPEPSCPDNYDPVCGSDGSTYYNECEAKELYGIAIAHKGECPEPSSEE